MSNTFASDSWPLYLLSWLLTYTVHSTLLIGGVWLATRWLKSPTVRDTLWKAALIGGLVTATWHAGFGGSPFGPSVALLASNGSTADDVQEVGVATLPSASQPATPSTVAQHATNPPVSATPSSWAVETSYETAPIARTRTIENGETGGQLLRELRGVARRNPHSERNRTGIIMTSSSTPSRASTASRANLPPADRHDPQSSADRASESAVATLLTTTDPVETDASLAAALALRAKQLADGARRMTRAARTGVDSATSWTRRHATRTNLILSFVACWAIGALFGLSSIARAFVRLAVVLRGRRVVHEGTMRATLTRLCLRSGMRRHIKLTASRAIPGPIAIGLGEICVPERALIALSAEQQESALAHELAHLVRRDPTWLVAGALIERLFFFQPLNRLAMRGMRESSELLCDDWAVQRTGRRLTLATCLAEVAGWFEGSPQTAPVAGMADTSSPLLKRVERLLADHQPERAYSRARVPMALAALVLIAALAPGVLAIEERQRLLAVRPGSGEVEVVEVLPPVVRAPRAPAAPAMSEAPATPRGPVLPATPRSPVLPVVAIGGDVVLLAPSRSAAPVIAQLSPVDLLEPSPVRDVPRRAARHRKSSRFPAIVIGPDDQGSRHQTLAPSWLVEISEADDAINDDEGYAKSERHSRRDSHYDDWRDDDDWSSDYDAWSSDYDAWSDNGTAASGYTRAYEDALEEELEALVEDQVEELADELEDVMEPHLEHLSDELVSILEPQLDALSDELEDRLEKYIGDNLIAVESEMLEEQVRASLGSVDEDELEEVISDRLEDHLEELVDELRERMEPEIEDIVRRSVEALEAELKEPY